MSLDAEALYDYLDSQDTDEFKPQFCVSEWTATDARLSLDGIDDHDLRLPIEKRTAEKIKFLCHIAAFGLGPRTVVDRNVRDTWELDPKHVHMSKEWDTTLQQIVLRVQEALAPDTSIRAELYKLLLYEEGQFFKPHRDTEKEKGMFATLVVQLPSRFEGGSLIVNHKGESKKIDSDQSYYNSSSRVHYTAFYADCEHEILPITKGYRLVLVYNVVFDGEPAALGDYLPEDRPYITQLQKWAQQKAPRSPKKCIFMLDYQYTRENMSFTSLKGGDRLMVRKLLRLGTVVPLNVALVHVDYSIRGMSKHLMHEDMFHKEKKLASRRRRRYSDSDSDCSDSDESDDWREGREYTHDLITQTDDEKLTVTHQVFASDSAGAPYQPVRYEYEPYNEKEDEGPVSIGVSDETQTHNSDLLKLDCKEMMPTPSILFEDAKPDDDSYEPYYGNDGASLSLRYHRTAVVFWPKEDKDEASNEDASDKKRKK